MKFTVSRLEIPDLLEIEHQSFADERGFFAEVFRESDFAAAGMPGPFVQENHSRSTKGVLRGLHYQLPPKAQGKLIRVSRGAIFDIAVDLRKGSPYYRKWVGRELSESNRRLLYIPPGFAHGFYTLSDIADVVYKQTDYYSPEHERGIRWDDPALAIQWPSKTPVLSPKDAKYPFIDRADHDFAALAR